MGEKAKRLVQWLSRWGFAVLVGLGAFAAAWVAASVDLPKEIPGFALRAAPVYRLEVGAAFFAGVYLCSMTFVLALNNRAFSEIGTAGTRAQDIRDLGDREHAVGALTRSVRRLQTELSHLEGGDG